MIIIKATVINHLNSEQEIVTYVGDNLYTEEMQRDWLHYKYNTPRILKIESRRV